MQIRRVSLSGFFGLSRDVVFPESGLVLVTGPNGSGKSALIEAVAATVWGQSIRGSKISPKGSAEIHTESVWAKADFEKSVKGALQWGLHNQPSDGYDTPTKARGALIDHLGMSFEAWVRTSVFSSAGVSFFSGATDAERKRLIEEILGFDRFSSALIAAKEALQDNQKRQADLKVESGRLAQTIAFHRGVLSGVQDTGDLEKIRALCAQVTATRTDLRAQIADWRRSLTRCEEDYHEAVSVARAADIEVERLEACSNDDVCSLCLQPMLTGSIDHRISKAEARARQARMAIDPLKSALQKTREKHRLLEDKERDLSATIREYEGQIRDAERRQKQVLEAQEKIEALSDQAYEAESQFEGLAQDASYLSQVVDTLGTKGARVLLLQRTLRTISEVASEWLSVLSDEKMLVSIGESGDAVAIEVKGLRGEDYASASSGERRRIDLAILLALSEIAPVVRGVPCNGTLWLDEVFDSLDSAGVKNVHAVLSQLSAKRPVIVISHDPRTLEALGSEVDLHLDLESAPA